jgi:hypothetical protein
MLRGACGVAVAAWDADGRADLLVGDCFSVKIPAPVPGSQR